MTWDVTVTDTLAELYLATTSIVIPIPRRFPNPGISGFVNLNPGINPGIEQRLILTPMDTLSQCMNLCLILPIQ